MGDYLFHGMCRADNNGIAFILHGDVRGPAGDGVAGRHSGEMRLNGDAKDPRALTGKNEMAVRGGPGSLIEEPVMTPDDANSIKSVVRLLA